MLIKPPCSNEQTELKKKEPKKVEVDFEKYPRPEGSLLGTLAYERPDLLEEWDYEKNNELGLDPLKLKCKSNKPAQWKCKKCGYEWQATTNTRTRGNSSCCPACIGKAVTSINNLAYKFPDLLEDWDYEKNNKLGLDPYKLFYGSHKCVHWVCHTCSYPRGTDDEWYVSITQRTGRDKSGCPACKHKVVTPWYNLKTEFPYIAEEWDSDNNKTTPDKVLPGCKDKAWWKCKTCGYSWSAFICNRIKGSGCPECAKGNQTSFPELAIYFYIHKYFEDTVNTYKELGFELDIYIPSKNIAIEYDGVKWHSNKQSIDQEKADICSQNNIKLVRVREIGLPYINNCIIVDIKPASNHKDLGTCIEYILKKYLCIEQPKVNIDQDLGIIKSQIKRKTLDNSLATLYPEIAEEFMSEKNLTTPDKVAAHSNDKYWWKCKACGYEWYAILANRTNKTHKRGCPKCKKSSHLITEDRTLTKLYPELLSEYSNKNVETANEIAAKSGKSVDWICSNCNKTYSLRVDVRTASGVGCPHCHAGRHPEFRKQRRYIDEQGKLVIEQK